MAFNGFMFNPFHPYGVGDPQIRDWYGVGDPQIRAQRGPKSDFTIHPYGLKSDYTMHTAGCSTCGAPVATGGFNSFHQGPKSDFTARTATSYQPGEGGIIIYGNQQRVSGPAGVPVYPLGLEGAYHLQAYTNQDGWHDIIGHGVYYHYLCQTIQHLAANPLWNSTPLRVFAGDQLLAGGHYFSAARWAQMLCS